MSTSAADSPAVQQALAATYQHLPAEERYAGRKLVGAALAQPRVDKEPVHRP